MAPILGDVKAAAYQAGRPEATIRWWAHKGWIATYGSGRGKVKYDLGEVPACVRCEFTKEVLVPADPPGTRRDREPAAA